MKLLLTGFEPFGGQDLNPSEQCVAALVAGGLEGIELFPAILPVDRKEGPAALLAALEVVQPQAVVCLGEAGRRARMSIERVAVNLLDFRIPDNRGEQVLDQPVVPGGPDAYFVTLPVRPLLEAVTVAGVPAELSLSAGTFLCNQVLYVLLHRLAQGPGHVPAGFIHLPYLPEQVARLKPAEGRAVPSMALETMLAGLRAALAALRAAND